MQLSILSLLFGVVLNVTNALYTQLEIDRNQCNAYANDGTISPVQNTVVDDIIVGGAMKIEFYFTVNSVCASDWCNILSIGNGAKRFPAFIIRGPSFLWIDFNTNPAYKIELNMPDQFIANGIEHLLYFEWSSTQRILKIDGIELYSDYSVINAFTDTSYLNVIHSLYLSRPDFLIVDIDMRDICIVSSADQGPPVAQIDRNQCNAYANEGIISPVQNTIVDDIIVGGAMKIEFYFTVNSVCAYDWCNILSIGNGVNRFPAFFTRKNSPSFLWIDFNTNPAYKIELNTPDQFIPDGPEHLLYFEWSSTQRIVQIDGIELYSDYSAINAFTDTSYLNRIHSLYLSRPDFPIADIDMRDICIVSSADQGPPVAQIDRIECNAYANDGTISPVQNTVVDDIIVGGAMKIEFYFTVNSVCASDWCNILSIGNDYKRFPAFIIRGPSFLWIDFNTNPAYKIELNTPYQFLANGIEHLLYFEWSSTQRIVKIDGVELYSDDSVINAFTDTSYLNSIHSLYLSRPDFPIADIDMRDICIVSNGVTPTTVPTGAPTFEPCTNDDIYYNIQFVVDESGSINSVNYAETIDFVIDLIVNDVNSVSSVAAMAFSTDNDRIYSFNDPQDDQRSSVVNKLRVEKTDYDSQWTDTYSALVEGLREFVDVEFISNQDENLLFLLTDGKPKCDEDGSDTDCREDVCAQTQLLNDLSEYNIRIITIGITDGFDATRLECLSHQNDVFLINDFSSEEFKRIETELRLILCPSAQMPQNLELYYVNNNNNNGNKEIDYFSSKYLIISVLTSITTTIFIISLFYSCFYYVVSKKSIYNKVSKDDCEL